MQSCLAAVGILIVFLIVARRAEKYVVETQTNQEVKSLVEKLHMSDSLKQFVDIFVGNFQASYAIDDADDVIAADKNRVLIKKIIIVIAVIIPSCLILSYVVCYLKSVSFWMILLKSMGMVGVLMITEAFFIMIIAKQFKVADASVMQAQIEQSFKNVLTEWTSDDDISDNDDEDDDDSNEIYF